MIEDSVISRFSSKYEINSKTECWEWKEKRLTGIGYGRFYYKGKEYLAHRFSMILQGKDPTGYFVCHHCDNPKCVNPQHLYLGNAQTNTQDQKDRNRLATGEKNAESKLTWEKVDYIRKHGVISPYGKHQGNIKQLANMFNVDPATIRNVLKNKTWKA